MMPGRQGGLTLLEILIAIVVVGIAVSLFMNLQRRSGSRLAGNSNLLKAGQIIERHMEAMRISIARDTVANWPPRDTSFKENRITLVRRISAARSPKTGDLLPNVRRVDVITAWGTGQGDSLNISTYVAKRH
jgi:prepilin-type N-terminal cleavage/methylation domain-containing protein